MSGPLVLSLFPGIGLLDRAFEEEGFCVVRGPDLLWGGDVRTFHPPMDCFEGIVGSPPCQAHSPLAQLRTTRAIDLTHEFARCVDEAWPDWFLTENVPTAPSVRHDSYAVTDFVLNNRWLGAEQRRRRRWTFGLWRGERGIAPVDLRSYIDWAALEAPRCYGAVTAAHAGDQRVRAKGRIPRYTVPEACRLQGLPEDFLADAPFTAQGKLSAVANGVPLPMGRAIARAVRRALGLDTTEEKAQ